MKGIILNFCHFSNEPFMGINIMYNVQFNLFQTRVCSNCVDKQNLRLLLKNL
jgi:hypothetical protein